LRSDAFTRRPEITLFALSSQSIDTQEGGFVSIFRKKSASCYWLRLASIRRDFRGPFQWDLPQKGTSAIAKAMAGRGGAERRVGILDSVRKLLNINDMQL
jgi:hypothetical protein